MKISQKVNYACLAMLELAVRAEEPHPVPIKTIADAHKLKPRFLVQILLQLKTAGHVVSVRGASGGYHLSRSPEDINLSHVLEAFGYKPEEAPNIESDMPTARVLAATWRELQAEEQRLLQQHTLADLVQQAQEPANLNYQI